MSFGEKILDYKEDILKDLDELLKIQSVSSKSQEDASEALKFILKRAEEMGLTTENVDDIAGHAEYGKGDEIAAVLSHVDVVPSGDGWSVEPFALTRKNGRLYGRGTADDKGPAIIALYCLKALKDSGVSFKRRLRTIFGASEEVGMADMDRYFSKQPLPNMGFTPDLEYGICNVEKGILQIEVYSNENNAKTLTAMKAGNAINAVAAKAYALIDCSETEDHQLRRFADAKPCDYDFDYTIDGMQIISKGKAAHGSTPELGFNAATNLIRLLAANFGQTVLGSLCAFLDDAVGLETDGFSLGIKCSDKQSGALTVNVGTVDIGETYMKATLDIRYPVSADSDDIIFKIRQRAAYDGLKIKIKANNPPLYVPETAPIIGLLKDAYKTITGEEANLFSTGGGTYARTLQNRGVAFGAIMNEECNIHAVDESMDEEKFFLHAQICLEAMYNLATK